MIYTYTCTCSSFQVGTVNYSSIFTRWIKVIKLVYVNIKIRDTFLNVPIERAVVFDINIGAIYVFYFHKRLARNAYTVIY